MTLELLLVALEGMHRENSVIPDTVSLTHLSQPHLVCILDVNYIRAGATGIMSGGNDVL